MGKIVQKAYRIDDSFYDEVENFLNSIGMTAPQAINMFFKRMMMERQLPFTPGIVKSKVQLDAEVRLLELTDSIEGLTVNFETGEHVEDFFDE